MAESLKLKDYFGTNLAELLADKLVKVHSSFPRKDFVKYVARHYEDLELKDRVKLIAKSLTIHLPADYPTSIDILTKIYGVPNPNETGMFKVYYWLMPIGEYIETNGLDYFDISMKAIYGLTQRNTGEYTVRPFINRYPKKSIKYFTKWSMDKSFHVRRLASEGLRPKLPWAKKLDVFIDNYEPVFTILNNLKEDNVKFVKKSVANCLNDYLKLNYAPTIKLINEWQLSDNAHTQWIVKHATRNFK